MCAAAVYRFRDTATLVIRDGSGYRLRAVPAGSMFFAAGSEPDENSMIDGTCNNQAALVFVRDQEDRAEAVEGEPVHSAR